jgi:hypothetical protein
MAQAPGGRGSRGIEGGLNLRSALSCTVAGEATRDIGGASGGAERDNDNLRPFGYFEAEPVIALRTAHETIKVLAALR